MKLTENLFSKDRPFAPGAWRKHYSREYLAWHERFSGEVREHVRLVRAAMVEKQTATVH
jgi:hypothetical protein